MYRSILGLGMAATIVAGCSGPSTNTSSANVANQAAQAPLNDPPSPPPPPPHRYDVKDGADYGYTADLTPEDKNSGKATGNIVMFRYMGEDHGVYTLASPDKSGLTMTCASPCKMIKEYMDGSLISRQAYNENSVIGAAFEDALNGYLETPFGSSTEGKPAFGGTPGLNDIRPEDLGKRYPQAAAAWRRQIALYPDIRDQPWVKELNGTATPMRVVSVDGSSKLYGELCQPHSCPDGVAFIVDPESQQIVGEVTYMAKNFDGQYGTRTQLIGSPDEKMAACLRTLRDSGATAC